MEQVVRFEGYEFVIFRADDGIVTVEVHTGDVDDKDRMPPHDVARMRIIIEEEFMVTTPEGGLVMEEH